MTIITSGIVSLPYFSGEKVGITFHDPLREMVTHTVTAYGYTGGTRNSVTRFSSVGDNFDQVTLEVPGPSLDTYESLMPLVDRLIEAGERKEKITITYPLHDSAAIIAGNLEHANVSAYFEAPYYEAQYAKNSHTRIDVRFQRGSVAINVPSIADIFQ